MPKNTVQSTAPAAPMGQSLGGGADADSINAATDIESVKGGYDTDDLAAKLDEMDAAEGGSEDSAGEDAAPAAEGAEPAENAAPEGEQDAEIPMPDGFDAEVWKEVPQSVRKAVQARETAHAEALAQERQQSAAVRQNRDQNVRAAAEAYQQMLRLASAVVEGEFSGVDWQALANQDPATFMQLSQRYNQRKAAIKQMDQNFKQQAQAYVQQATAERQASLREEARAVEPKLQAMFGSAYNAQNFAKEAGEYLAKHGMPATAFKNLTKGYEIEIVAKAMAYDKGLAARKAATEKLAKAPTVEAGGRSALHGDGDAALKRAKSILHKNPRSTQALADVLGSLY